MKFWIIGAGSGTVWMVEPEPEIWFRIHSRGLWRKQVNLLRANMVCSILYAHNFYRLCVDQGLSNFFAHLPLFIKCIISQYLICTCVIIKLYN